ncbi:MAG: carboxypeptidase-like regulatory domain-containing protein [Acidobacteriota bacterium]
MPWLKFHTLSLFLISMVLSWSICLGDTLTGEVRGSVVDIEGLVALPEANVTLINVDRGWEKQLDTDVKGNYNFIQLEPGNYTVLVDKSGYYQAERTDVLIRLNRPKVVIPPFELRKLVATPTQQITLRGEQTKIAIIDLTAPGPSPSILAYISEPGLTSMVSLNDWALRANYDASLVQGLPLRGTRTFDQLALLSPGVFRVPFSSGVGPAVGIGVGTSGQFSVNGLRGRSNNFTVDGSDNNDEDIGVRRQGFVVLIPQSIESVREFQIVTGGFSAEFGRNSGSMVNVVSRSGEKDIHGSVYGIWNDDVLNAADFFENPFEDTVNIGNLNGGAFTGDEFSQKQLGGVLGGPLIAERLFYFGSVEYQSHQTISMRDFVVPGPEARGLRTRDGFVPIDELGSFLENLGIPYSDLAGRSVFELYPLPNNTSGPFSQNNYTQVRPGEGSGLMFSMKMDWYPASAHSFSARYNFTDDQSIIPFTSEAINSSLGTDTRTQNLSLYLNSTTTRYGNALRFSYGRTRLTFPPQQESPLLFGSSPSQLLPPRFAQVIETPYGRFGPFGATGPIGQLAIAPFSTIGVDVFNFPQGRTDNTFQISDFVTRTGGTHTLKMGFDIRRSQLNSFSDRNARPLVIFANGLVSTDCVFNPSCVFATDDGRLRGTDLAALGAPAGFLQTLSTGPVPDTTIGLRFTQFDFFVQEEWKVTESFTLNLGLRYELQTVPREVNDRIEGTFNLEADRFGHLEPTGSPDDQAIIIGGNRAFDDALGAVQNFLAGRERIYAADRNNLAPRLGFAWDPFGNGKTVIRAGYGISYDANLGAATSQSRNVFPTFAPINLDLNFNLPTGLILNSPSFFTFVPTGDPLIRPGSLNSYNLGEEAFATGLGSLFVQAPPFPGGSLSSNGLAFTLPEKHFENSYAQHLVFSAQRQWGDAYLVSASYVGTRGLHLTRFVTPNAGLIATPVLFSDPFVGEPLSIFDLPPVLSPTARGRPEQELGAYTVFQNSASSTYHSLQLSVEKRLSQGFQFQASWTWAHALDEVSDLFDGRAFFSLPQDSSRLGLERASANFDARHRLSWFFTWDLGTGSAHPLLKDWKLLALGEFQTGQPFTVNTSLDQNFDGNLTDRLDSVTGVTTNPQNPSSLELAPGVDPLNLLASRGEQGKVGRNSFRAQGIATIDLALSRSFSVAEETTFDVRLEVFNLLNRTHFGIPVRILESPGFGKTFDTQVRSRSIRLALKLSF